jgi:hypothetical protein
MKQDSKLNNPEKRSSLERLRNLSLGSAVLTSMALSGGWVRPVVNQVMLPAHAKISPGPVPCGVPQIAVNKLNCSSGLPVELTITSSDGSLLRILSVPGISTTPVSTFNPNVSGSWKQVVGEPVPKDITDIIAYEATIRGQVFDDDKCLLPPMTNSPLGQPPREVITVMEISIEYQCLSDGSSAIETIDIIPLLQASL